MSNNTSSQQTTFWEYLQKHEIEIPIIQRDYAQGRVGKEELRKSFLSNLKQALDNNQKLKLDFVYGSNKNNKMNPLDGQQRLTTLWLLHWYIALKTGKLDEKIEIEGREDSIRNVFKRFSYETRVSSREFIECLCKYENNPEIGNLVSDIQNQTWFYSAWKQDPTIQSMLRMLSGTTKTNKDGNDIIDGIEVLFDGDTDFKNYWEQLTETNEKTCPIVFYSLDLNGLNLTDDLYIKMNARGEQLSSFENLKADLVGYIKSQNWKDLLNPTEGIPIKMDTTWMDIFWKNKSENGKIDDIYFAFLNRFFLNELFIAKDNDKYILDIGKGDETSTQENKNPSYKYLNDDIKIVYSNFDVYKYFNEEIPKELFSSLQIILNNYKKFVEFSKNNNSKPIIPECTWDKSFHFIPQYEKDNNGSLKVLSINQIQRIVFFAICKYFGDFKNNAVKEENYKSFERWMRVVWNLVSGEDNSGRPQIRSTASMRTAIEFIEMLNSQDVYASLVTLDIGNSTDFDFRCLEEREKANQILHGNSREDGKSWEKVIIEAENFAFFKGSIRFLFRTNDDNWNWANFDTKWKNAKEYFDKEGIRNDYRVDLTKALVIQCDNWDDQLYDKQIFNPNATTWKWILNANNWANPIHNILMAIPPNVDKVIFEGIEDLISLPFKEIVGTKPESRFHKYNNTLLGLYKPHERQNPIILDWLQWNRNKILSSLCNNVNSGISSDKKIEGCNFFWGWDINFTYKKDNTKYYFQWHSNGYIYLMNEDWKEYKERNHEKTSEEEKYFCFKANSDDISEEKLPEILKEFINELNKLIESSPQTT